MLLEDVLIVENNVCHLVKSDTVNLVIIGHAVGSALGKSSCKFLIGKVHDQAIVDQIGIGLRLSENDIRSFVCGESQLDDIGVVIHGHCFHVDLYVRILSFKTGDQLIQCRNLVVLCQVMNDVQIT